MFTVANMGSRGGFPKFAVPFGGPNSKGYSIFLRETSISLVFPNMLYPQKLAAVSMTAAAASLYTLGI